MAVLRPVKLVGVMPLSARLMPPSVVAFPAVFIILSAPALSELMSAFVTPSTAPLAPLEAPPAPPNKPLMPPSTGLIPNMSRTKLGCGALLKMFSVKLPGPLKPAMTPEVMPPKTALFKTSAGLPPVTKDDRPPPIAPAIKGLTRAKPAGPRSVVAAIPTTAPIIDFSQPNSGRPVSGLMVPWPPIRLSISASNGLMCANIVSPLRPANWTLPAASFKLAMPPLA